MKCTTKNIEKVFHFLQNHHEGYSLGAERMCNDESDLLTAVENSIRMIEKNNL